MNGFRDPDSLTVRDEFAIEALGAIVQAHIQSGIQEDNTVVARNAYGLADAMMRERQGNVGPQEGT